MKNFILLIILLTVLSLPALDPRYHTNEEIIAELDSLQNLYPDIAAVHQIGTSLGAYPYCPPMPIWALKISDNVTVDEDEAAVLFLGQVHAEEVLGVEITMHMINEILENRFIAPYNIWIQNLEIWFVPTYNPEGLDVVMSGLDDSWRKNQRDNNLNELLDLQWGPGGDIDGVDINRNYPFNWIHGDSLYAEGNEEWNDYYRGPGPLSEGETQAIHDLAAQQHFILSIAWHSSRSGNLSEQLFWSFQWTEEKKSPDFEFNQVVGETVAYLIVTENGTGYYEPSPSLGRKGNAHDWFYKTHGTTQLLIECGTSNLQPPAPMVDDTCQRCSVGAYWMLNRAVGYQTSRAMLTGHVTDAVSGDPLVAEIIVEEKKASFFSPRLSDELYGRFWRPLMPGTYSLTIRKEGYQEKIIESVTINNSAPTILDIELDPLDPAMISGNVSSAGEPLEAEIIVYSLEEYSIPVDASGNYQFDWFAGELNMRIWADGFVPRFYNEQITAGVQTIDFELDSAVVVFQEDFEDGFSNWIVEGDWAVVTSNTGENYLDDSPESFYENLSDKYITTLNPVNLNGVASDVVLCFEQRYQVEHDYDQCQVEISTGGNNWQILRSFSGVRDQWHFIAIPLSDYVDNHVNLRFRLTSDASLVDPGWKVDDIMIISSVGADSSSNQIPPATTRLIGNYPNPFNPETTISLSLAEQDRVKLTVYNIKGEKVTILADEDKEPGIHLYEWDGTDRMGRSVSSGIYFYRLNTSSYQKTRKMILIK